MGDDAAPPVRLRHRLEYGLAKAVTALARALPLTTASALFGAIARWIGAPLPLSKRADANLRLALPELSAGERRAIIRGMWRHLGRMVGEFPHLEAFRQGEVGGPGTVEIVGGEILDALTANGRGVLIFAAHLGNWELLRLSLAHLGHHPMGVYRAANNPLVNALIEDLRGDSDVGRVPKGRPGARAIVATLKRGGSVAMLVDQKLNDGIAVPFFGHPAMTAPAIAEMARRFDLPIVPLRSERLEGTRLRCTIYPPIHVARDGAREADVLAAMTRINEIVESWIRERPEQWLWLHRRWPREATG